MIALPASQPPPAPPAPVAVVGAALVDVLARPTQLLAARRTEPPDFAGWWELPGGKVDPGESDLQALHREIREELGVSIMVGDKVIGPLPDGRFPLGERYAMSVWLAEVVDGEPAPIENHDLLRWLTPDELGCVQWLPDDLPIVAAIGRRLTRAGRC